MGGEEGVEGEGRRDGVVGWVEKEGGDHIFLEG